MVIIFFLALNRNPKLSVSHRGAEYIANMLQKGTHDYAVFGPSEAGTLLS